MVTMYVSPYRRLTSLREAMDHMLEQGSYAENAPQEREMTLALDVEAQEDSFVIKALVPGLEAEDLNIEILNNTVTIRGEFKGEDREAKYLISELPEGRFARTITLPVEVDSAKTEASLKNGVLMLILPKAEAHRPKAIKVSIS
jgi:HSP20 family protein